MPTAGYPRCRDVCGNLVGYFIALWTWRDCSAAHCSVENSEKDYRRSFIILGKSGDFQFFSPFYKKYKFELHISLVKIISNSKKKKNIIEWLFETNSLRIKVENSSNIFKMQFFWNIPHPFFFLFRKERFCFNTGDLNSFLKIKEKINKNH